MKRTIRHAYSDKLRIGIAFPEFTRAKQSFRDECDINLIMAKFAKTGVMTHVREQNRNYGFATSRDLREGLQLIAEADEMFNELPAGMREKFHNNPGEFLDFVGDEANRPEMASMGLLNDEATYAEESKKAAKTASEAVSPAEPPSDTERTEGAAL